MNRLIGFLVAVFLLAGPALAAGVNDPDDLPFVDATLSHNAHDFTLVGMEDVFTYSGLTPLPSGRQVHVFTSTNDNTQYFCERPTSNTSGILVGSRVHLAGQVMIDIKGSVFVMKTCGMQLCSAGSSNLDCIFGR